MGGTTSKTIKDFFLGSLEKPKEKKTNKMETFFNLLQSNVGTGILALAFAVMCVGLVTGVLLLAFVGVFCVWCIDLLLVVYKVVSPDGKKLDYAEVAEKACERSGKPGVRTWAPFAKHATNTVLVLNQIGTCIAYHVFCPKMITKVVTDNYLTDEPTILHSLSFWIVMITVVLLVYCVLFRNFKDVAIFSTITCAVMVGCLAIIYQYMIVNVQPIEKLSMYPQSVDGFFQFIGIVMFSFEVTSMVLPIENSMNETDRPAFRKVMWTAMMIVVALYTFTGAIGYACFGSESLVILASLPSHSYFGIFGTVTVLWVVCIIVSYNMQVTVPADILANLIARKLWLPRKYPELVLAKEPEFQARIDELKTNPEKYLNFLDYIRGSEGQVNFSPELIKIVEDFGSTVQLLSTTTTTTWKRSVTKLQSDMSEQFFQDRLMAKPELTELKRVYPNDEFGELVKRLKQYIVPDMIVRFLIIGLTFVLTWKAPYLEEVIALIGVLFSSLVTTGIPAGCLLVIALTGQKNETANRTPTNVEAGQELMPILGNPTEANTSTNSDSTIAKSPRSEPSSQPKILTKGRRVYFLFAALILVMFGLLCCGAGAYFNFMKLHQQIYQSS